MIHELGILPTKRDDTNKFLDSVRALDLAILGATAIRMTPFEHLINTVHCLTGSGWNPPEEVISAALKFQIHHENILETESWVQSIPFSYSLTTKGAHEFNTLMRKPLPAWDNQISQSSALVKFCLLDVVDFEYLNAAAEDLSHFHRGNRENLQARRKSLSADRQFLYRAISDQIFWVDRQINAVEELVNKRRCSRAIN